MLIDDIIAANVPESERMAAWLAREEWLCVGTSLGRQLHEALKVATTRRSGERVVTILCDTGERYHF